MIDVLKGHKPSPVDMGLITLHEVADAFYSRAAEITARIQYAELLGRVKRGSPEYKFRTGPLRTFMAMCQGASALGSRRITEAELRFEMERFGRESLGRRL